MSSTPTQPGAGFDGSGLIANRYQIKQKLGKGTYGEVFLADDLKFRPARAVAIKILHSKFLNEAEVRADIVGSQPLCASPLFDAGGIVFYHLFAHFSRPEYPLSVSPFHRVYYAGQCF